MGRVDEAIEYAEKSLGRSDGGTRMARFCEQILLDAGRADEAYRLFGIEANQGTSRLATFRAIAKKYPGLDKKRILADLLASTPGEEGKWFATACELKLYELAVELATRSACDPKTLNRAARDLLESQPAFSLKICLLSLHWLSRGYGWEITGLDVHQAYDGALKAARMVGCEAEIFKRIEAMLADDQSVGMFLSRVLEPRLKASIGTR